MLLAFKGHIFSLAVTATATSLVEARFWWRENPCFRADFKHNFPRHMELLVELLWILLHSLRLTCLDHKHCAVCSFLEKKNALRVRICSIRVELLDFIYCSPTISAHPCDNGQECLGRRFTIMPDSEDGT